jgi:hypothetical protein
MTDELVTSTAASVRENDSDAREQLRAFVEEMRDAQLPASRELRDLTGDEAVEQFLTEYLGDEEGRPAQTIADYRRKRSSQAIRIALRPMTHPVWFRRRRGVCSRALTVARCIVPTAAIVARRESNPGAFGVGASRERRSTGDIGGNRPRPHADH